MKISEVMSVTGLPGLHKLVANRSNGLIVMNIDGKSKSRFVSSRKHQFSPLESISIYVLGDTIQLTEVFEKMRLAVATNPPVDAKAEKHEIFEYFESIVPNYDEDLVKEKDIRKIIKWFGLLNELGYLDPSEDEEE